MLAGAFRATSRHLRAPKADCRALKSRFARAQRPISARPEADFRAPKKRKRVAVNTEGRAESDNIEDRRNPHQSAFTGDDEYATDTEPLGKEVLKAYKEAARRRKMGRVFDDHDYDD